MVSSLVKRSSDCFNSLWTGDGEKTFLGQKGGREEKKGGGGSKQTYLMRMYFNHFCSMQSVTGTEAPLRIWIRTLGAIVGLQRNKNNYSAVCPKSISLQLNVRF